MKKYILSILTALVLLIPWVGTAQEHDLFKVKTPNVMIIFDTSGSMEMSVNVDSTGSSIWTTKKGPDGSTQYRKDGNHPDSRLYQAKQALSQIIDEVVKDRVNLGFSTYAQKKMDRRRGRYQREEEVIDQAAVTEGWMRQKRYYVWGTTNDSTRTANSLYSNSFNDAWGVPHTNVTVGTTFTRAIWIHDKSGPLHPQRCSSGAQCVGGFKALKAFTITYKVTAITLNPETKVSTFTYGPTTPAYDYYWESTFDDGLGYQGAPVDCGLDKKGLPMPNTKSSSGMTWKTHFSDDTPPTEYITPSNGRTAGWWNCWVIHRLQKDKISHMETKYSWADTSGTNCDATKAGTPVWTYINGTCFDWSYFRYTPEGTVNRPHTWSYFKIDGSNNWKKGGSFQPDPFYPALPGNPGENNNHHFFINFPDDKDPLFKAADRTTIKNAIMSYLDLTPVKKPDAAEYWTKLPVQAIAGKTGLSANTDAFNLQKQTPLADSLAWAYTYFYDYINTYHGGDPSSKEKYGETLCRGNYVIFLTDGLESCRFSGGQPDYNAAVVEAGNLFTINVQTFVIGFGGDVTGNQTLNNIALAGSGGKQQAYFATDMNQLKSALRSIFQVISTQFYGRSNPVITRQRERLFRGSFETRDEDWVGHLMAWDADKETGVLAPDFAWDAGEKMTINGRGTVYTWTGDGLNPARKEFKATEHTLYPLVNPSGEDINGDGFFDNDDARTIIYYTLYPRWDDGKYKGKRAIDVDIKGTTYFSWKLGDVYHSTPVIIGEPSFFFTDHDYRTFYHANKGREMMIYVGTNDGMLHGVRNTDGNEKFAVIPKSLLGKVKNLSLTHEYYVDASPKAYDVYFQSDSKWKTVLISGLRGGGPYYFALDVTNPDDPKILWEWPNPVNDPVNPDATQAHMGDGWAKPDIGKVKVGAETKFAAFITGGYSTTADRGNSFHIIDIETGSAIKSFIVGSATNKIPCAPTLFDVDQDGLVNYVYFGDIQGTLWKVDVSSTSTSDWTLYEFFKDELPKRRPIFYAPAVAKNDEGKILVFFGTGDELNLTSVQVNYFYEIEDQGATGKQVWTRNLDPGEKVLSSPYVANWVVYFTTWYYMVAGEYCGAGEGRLWGLKISKLGAPGASEGLVTLDPATGKWTAPQNYITLGAGIPASPLVTNGMIYIATSLNANRVIQIPIPGWAVARTKSWREVF